MPSSILRRKNARCYSTTREKDVLTIRWRLALPYVALILLATAALTVYLSGFVHQAHLSDL